MPFSNIASTLVTSLGREDNSSKIVREFVIGTKKGIQYSILNRYSPGGGRNEEWYTDIADVMLESHPKDAQNAMIEINKKVLEDLLHSYGIVHGRIVPNLTRVNDIWFVNDEKFEKMINSLAAV